jgi:hypothetical protein
MRLLGGLLVALSLCGVLGTVMTVMTGRRVAAATSVGQVVGAMVYLVPGLADIVLAIFLKQRQLWALVASIVLTSIQLLFATAGTVMLVGIYLSDTGMFPRLFLIAPAIMAIVMLAVGQLLYLLCRSFPALQMPPFGSDGRGFEPLGVRPITAWDATTGPGAPIQTGAAAGDPYDHTRPD